MDEKTFTKGFNNGYLLAQHRPDLLKSIMPSLEQGNDYTDGIQWGAKEYEMEKTKTITNQKEQLNNEKKRGIDMERG